MLMMGVVSKEDHASAARVHQAAVDATKSPEGGGRRGLVDCEEGGALAP